MRAWPEAREICELCGKQQPPEPSRCVDIDEHLQGAGISVVWHLKKLDGFDLSVADIRCIAEQVAGQHMEAMEDFVAKMEHDLATLLSYGSGG